MFWSRWFRNRRTARSSDGIRRAAGASSSETVEGASGDGPATAAGVPVPGGWVAPKFPSRWQPLRPLGRGGQAEVWLAKDRELDHLVALKLFVPRLDKVGERRIRREALLGRTLRHPGLVRVYEVLRTSDGRLGIAMEWCERGSLAGLLKAGPPPVERVVALGEQALEGLAYLHERGVVHRDVKPSNLLLRGDGSLALGDFGLALPGDLYPGETATRSDVGTPLYMSPERVRGEPPSPASDLYSLGVTLYELLTGRPPFEGITDFEIAVCHLRRSPEDPRIRRPDTPRWLARFVLRLLEKAPADRWPDAGRALWAFRRRKVSRSRRVVRRFAMGTVAAAAAAVAAVGMIALLDAERAEVRAVRYIGRTLEAVSDRGRPVWTYTCPSAIREVVRGRFAPGGGERIAVVSAPDLGGGNRGGRRVPASVVILDVRGRVVTELLPEQQAPLREGLPPPLLVPAVTPLDLDGDGTEEVVVTAHHRVMAPSYLFVYWPHADRWVKVLEHQGGWIFDVAALPDSKTPKLRFLAFNGELGSFEVVAELVVSPPNRPPPAVGRSGIVGAAAAGGAEFAWYTPLGECWPGPATGDTGFSVEPDGSMRLTVRGHRWAVDRWGNPVPGPNAGRDLSQMRMEFLRRAVSVRATGFHGNPEAAARFRLEMAARFAPLVREPPLRALLDLTAARVLAAAGDPREGARLLTVTWRETGFGGVGLALAHLQALAGEFEPAVATLRRLAAEGRSPAGVTRAPELLRRLAIEMGDRQLFRSVLPLSPDFAENAELRAAAWARARLWWDEPTPADGSVHSHDLFPGGDAVAYLVRWRLGKASPEDENLMTVSLARNPEAAPEIFIARAMARLDGGDAPGALADLARADRPLAIRALHDFRADQVRRLAAGCRVLALVRAGRGDEARRLAWIVRPHLRPGNLPIHLIEEALGEAPRAKSSGG